MKLICTCNQQQRPHKQHRHHPLPAPLLALASSRATATCCTQYPAPSSSAASKSPPFPTLQPTQLPPPFPPPCVSSPSPPPPAALLSGASALPPPSCAQPEANVRRYCSSRRLPSCPPFVTFKTDYSIVSNANISLSPPLRRLCRHRSEITPTFPLLLTLSSSPMTIQKFFAPNFLFMRQPWLAMPWSCALDCFPELWARRGPGVAATLQQVRDLPRLRSMSDGATRAACCCFHMSAAMRRCSHGCSNNADSISDCFAMYNTCPSAMRPMSAAARKNRCDALLQSPLAC